jgi:SAM-dependent methyltransferase
MENEKIRKTVREGYAKIARESCSCGSGGASCCGGTASAESFLEGMGYSAEDLAGVSEGAIAGLACGNPIAHAKPRPGETVLDLGSGPGLDCFIAAKTVGPEGSVVGVDMTPEMIDRARRAASDGGFENVEFRLGEIENLPVADSSVDIVISNCVVNLSPDKARVFREAFRVLRAGGRLVVSDIVLLGALPDSLRDSDEMLVGCVANASPKEEYLWFIREAGFENVEALEERIYPIEGFGADSPAASVVVRAIKR